MTCAYALWRKVERLLVVVRAAVLVEQVEAELEVLGALVGEKAVERVVEHQRDQLPHDQNSLVSGRPATVLARERACPGPQRSHGRGVWGVSLVLQTPPPLGSHRCRSAGRSRGQIPGKAVEHLGGARVRWQAVLWPGRIVVMSVVYLVQHGEKA